MSEYSSSYKGEVAIPVRGKPMQEELKVGGSFFAATEHHDKYLPYEVHRRAIPVKPSYVVNPEPLSAETTQKANYVAWPVQARFERVKPIWEPGPKFEGQSTVKSEYVRMELPPKFIRIIPSLESAGPLMEKQSVQKQDYKPWSNLDEATGEVIAPVRGKPMKPELTVGGEFYGKSENAEKFPAHQVHARDIPAKKQYVPSTDKFESETTQKSNYQPWPVQNKFERKKPEYQPGPRFEGVSTTKEDYFAKPLPPKFQRVIPKSDFQ